MDDLLKDITGDYEYDKSVWEPIRREAALDMQNVAGNPWDKDDEKLREGRPTVAPEEMSQYRNQVVNALMANPRGAKFSPVGNGANDASAEFYQNKWREVEYRSHASQQYVIAADNALQRSYGFVRVDTEFESPRSANQQLVVDAFPDPDMVLPDADAKRLDSADQKRCTILEWLPQSEFKRLYPKAKIRNFLDGLLSATSKSWVQGDKILRAESWRITTRPRTLVLAMVPPPPGSQPGAPPRTLQIFDDEVEETKRHVPNLQVVRELREVDYPVVKKYFTNGLEILSEHEWAGKYIPIVSCYGKVIYVPQGGESKKVILSMTRFGRDPWKSYCYACSQELEILGQVPKAAVHVWKGQLRGEAMRKAWSEAPYKPKAFLESYHLDEDGNPYPSGPERIDYTQGNYLQAIEAVKEGFRRAIQAAMGSNFLPTNAQRINDKSGTALDKIDDVASQGTYHFVYAYDGMIRQCAVIGEDLIDKIHDYAGETGVILPDGKAKAAIINTPNNPESVSTQGDHLVTISTGPSSDSEREAASDFTDTLVKEMAMIEQVAGAGAAKKVLAISVRMRAPQLGPMAQELADILDPPQMGQDGKPIPPELMAAKAEIQQLQQQLQKAGQVIQMKQVEQQGKLAITQEQEKHEDFRASLDREKALAVAEIQAQTKQALQDMALFYEERSRIGAQIHERAMGGAESAHNIHVAHAAAASTAVEGAKDRVHEINMAELDHAHALEAGQQAAALQPAPEPQAAAGA